MKKQIMFGALSLISAMSFAHTTTEATKDTAKQEPAFIFTTIDSVAITPVKNQKNAGTCWSYSGMSFLESEAIKKTGKVYDFSEMFVVENTYMDRAEKSVRMHGDASFSQGGSFYDIVYCLKNYGLVPDVEMPAGKMYGDTLSNHTELSAMTNPLVEAAAKAKKLQFSPDGEPLWKKAVRAVHEVYLGKMPEKFTFEGKEYTPITFAQSTLLNADEYISITSLNHHPYSTGEYANKGIIIEVQDNWRWGESLNFELDDFMQVIDDAIKAGFTVLWGGDVSEDGFTRDGLAVYPDMQAPEAPGADQARWLKLDRKSKGAELTKKPLPQKFVSEEERQRGYDNFETGDDHGMHLFGIAKDQEGNKYYMVKNSWGKTGKYNGIWYMTPEYARAKTLNFVINKAALSKVMKRKYGLQ